MASHVQVILKDDVDNLGHIGEIVRVRAGYARNFLVPRGLAAPATAGSIKKIEHEMKLTLAKAEEVRAASQAIAATISAITVTAHKKAGASGKLYGSVTASEIVDLLNEQGHEFERKKLVLPVEAIKQAGSFEIGVKLGGGVIAQLKLEVVADVDASAEPEVQAAPEADVAAEPEAAVEVSSEDVPAAAQADDADESSGAEA
jgi:large subunit ribosomal protein L9